MPYFRDREQLYQVLDALFTRLKADPVLCAGLSEADFVLRFKYTEPQGQVTIDLRDHSFTWEFGETTLKSDLDMSQSADTAHLFWLGKLNVIRAIATRKVVSRGQVSKALKLLPVINNSFGLYRQALKDLGYDHLIPVEKARKPLSRKIRLFLRRHLRGLRRANSDYLRLDRSTIPLVDEYRKTEPSFRELSLPRSSPESLWDFPVV